MSFLHSFEANLGLFEPILRKMHTLWEFIPRMAGQQGFVLTALEALVILRIESFKIEQEK